jgi:hypothetical protein
MIETALLVKPMQGPGGKPSKGVIMAWVVKETRH